MDDSQFDKSLREKLGSYEPPGFDPAALASLHHQMAAITVTPWYATYRTELIMGGTVLLSALLIIWSQWMFTQNSTADLEAEILALKTKNENADQLRQELNHLKALKPDTIRIIEFQEQPSTVYLSLLRKIDRLESELRTMFEDTSRKNELLLAQANEKPNDAQFIISEPSLSYYPLANRIIPREKEKESKRAIANELPLILESPEKKLSVKTIKELQKHYQKGIGIRLGPSLLVSRGSFDPGDNRYNFGGGVLADFIVSPSLSVEAGIHHTQRHNRISNADILESGFPGADPSLGELKNIDIDSWVFETPLNIKYRYPVSMQSNWIIGGGYTAMIYTKQILEYDYQFGANQSASINSSLLDKNVKIYPGTLNVSLGFSSELKNKKIIETSLYYQHGLGKVGLEQTTPTFIGIRGAYWFTLK